MHSHPTNHRILKTTVIKLALRDSIIRTRNIRLKRGLVSITPHIEAVIAGNPTMAQIVHHLVALHIPLSVEEDCKPSSPTSPGRQAPALGAAVELLSFRRLRSQLSHRHHLWMPTTTPSARLRICALKTKPVRRRKRSRRASLRLVPHSQKHRKVALAFL